MYGKISVQYEKIICEERDASVNSRPVISSKQCEFISEVLMKIRTVFYALVACMVFALVGCGAERKAAPAEVGSLEMYTDDIMSFGIQYPSNWQKAVEPGKRALFFSDNAVGSRFVKYDLEGPSGARVQISIEELTAGIEEVLNKDNMFEASMYTPAEDATIAGQPGKKLTYSFDLSDGKFMGEKYVVAKDNYATVVVFEAFSGTFEALRPKFQEMLASVQLGHKKEAPVVVDSAVAAAPAEPFKPSATTVSFKGNGYTMNIPDNFRNTPTKSAGTLTSMKFKGIEGPQDCFIQVDVLDASKQKNIDKIIEQNKKSYNASSATETKIGGQKAYYLNYSLVRDVSSRAYFVVKGDKLYRITLNWFKPEQQIYLPAFEQALASFAF